MYDAEEVFHSAMQAARAGRHKQGAALFARFIQQCSRDPRAEDAAYMRVLSLRNAGDDAGTRQAARRYLASYRSGFRRAEVQALLDVAR